MKKSISIPDSLYDAFIQIYGEGDFSHLIQNCMLVKLDSDGYKIVYQPERYDVVKK